MAIPGGIGDQPRRKRSAPPRLSRSKIPEGDDLEKMSGEEKIYTIPIGDEMTYGLSKV